MSTPDLLTQFDSAVAAAETLSRDVTAYRALTDDALLQVARRSADAQRLMGTTAAVIAGEIARRSASSLGHDGLAQRTGHRTAIELVRVTTGLSGREAATAVRVGTLVQDAIDPRSWRHALGQAVGQGCLSVGAADSIRAGLGEPSARVSEAALAEATERLCAESENLDTDRLFRRARDIRDELDQAGIGERENERRDARNLSFTRLPDGMSRLTWLMDPETAAVTSDLWDRATSPRCGGPRFVAAGSADFDRAKQITDDPRSTGQLASDVFVELLRQGAAADSSQLLGSGAPVVHLLVLKATLDESDGEAMDASAGHAHGHGHLEGQLDSVSIETIQRALCSSTIEPILFDESGHALDVGRERRLYTRKQRQALAIRDGGCMFPGCERPPSWTEAHHTKHWTRDRGSTNIDDGILLCRHHHLLCHNNHWEIQRGEYGFVLIPPIDVDPGQVPISLPSKSAALRELRASAK